MAITFVLGVSSGVVGNLLYAKLIAGAKKLEISNKRTRISEEKVVEAIETIQQYVKENQEGNQLNQNMTDYVKKALFCAMLLNLTTGLRKKSRRSFFLPTRSQFFISLGIM